MDDQMKKLQSYVDKYSSLIKQCERFIWQHPETGFREVGTTEYLIGEFEKLGYQVTRPEGITGFIADLDTGRPGPKIAILGELDSLICATHPEADPKTRAVHACGHHCQATHVLGCAAVFSEKDALEGLSGSIRFVLVPAEETIELEFRNGLIRDGVISYVAGKIEFLKRGLFDGVDMTLMIHVTPTKDDQHYFEANDGSDGCITKHFEYQGVAAHAGGAPWDGVNALYAATLGLNAINALRETFKEQDYVRVHPIITEAGVAANAIPNVAKMDSYVRASTFEMMKKVNMKVNRALSAAAAAMGANLLIQDQPGNMPLHNSPKLLGLFRESVRDLFGEDRVKETPWDTGSSDIGDLSCLMPVMQPFCCGASGKIHGEDFQISSPELAVIRPVKVLVQMAYRLLQEDAALACAIRDSYEPLYSDKEAYFEAIDQIRMTKTAVQYTSEGSLVIDVCPEGCASEK